MANDTSSSGDVETASEKTIDGNQPGSGGVDQESQQIHEQQAAPDVPPNGGYGWVCVVCVGLINMHTWGLNSVSLLVSFSLRRSSFSLRDAYLRNDLHREAALTISSLTASSCLTLLATTHFQDLAFSTLHLLEDFRFLLHFSSHRSPQYASGSLGLE